MTLWLRINTNTQTLLFSIWTSILWWLLKFTTKQLKAKSMLTAKITGIFQVTAVPLTGKINVPHKLWNATWGIFLILASETERAKPWPTLSDSTFCNANVPYTALFNTAAASHMWLLSTWSLTTVTEEWNFIFYLTSMNLNL